MSSVQETTHTLLEAAATNIQNAILSSIISVSSSNNKSNNIQNDISSKIMKLHEDVADSEEENGLFSFMGNSSSQQNSSADDDDDDEESSSDEEDHNRDETSPNFSSFFKIFPSRRAITFIRKFAQKRNKNGESSSNSKAFVSHLTFCNDDDNLNNSNILSSAKTAALSFSSRLVEISDLHQPLGVGANAVVFRGKLLASATNYSFPPIIAVRCMVLRIDKTSMSNASSVSSSSSSNVLATNIHALCFELADKFCRGSAISRSLCLFETNNTSSSQHVMNSFGAFFIPMLLPTKSSARYDYCLACSAWELAKDGFTWQEWVNNNARFAPNEVREKKEAKILSESDSNRTNVILRQFLHLCQGVQQLHDQNIVHLDIKPRNAFVVDSRNITIDDENNNNNNNNGIPNVKLGDLDDCLMLSNSYSVSSPTDDATNSHHVCGTCWYSAPESIYLQKVKPLRAAGQDKVGQFLKKSDIWSLGVSLLQMLNLEGRHMYSYELMKTTNESQEVTMLFDPQEMILERLEAVGKTILEKKVDGEEKLELEKFLFGVDDMKKWISFCGFHDNDDKSEIGEKRKRQERRSDEVFETIVLKCIDLDPCKRPNITELIEKIEKLC